MVIGHVGMYDIKAGLFDIAQQAQGILQAFDRAEVLGQAEPQIGFDSALACIVENRIRRPCWRYGAGKCYLVPETPVL